jgi:hypothetical protein
MQSALASTHSESAPLASTPLSTESLASTQQRLALQESTQPKYCKYCKYKIFGETCSQRCITCEKKGECIQFERVRYVQEETAINGTMTVGLIAYVCPTCPNPNDPTISHCVRSKL